jgi:hypothetical protein
MNGRSTGDDDGRRELLLHMYDQLFNDINRHILVVWQSVATLLGSVALFALVEKGYLTQEVAVLLVLAACGWLLANVIDSGYWYNRNLAIIANIERQFLVQDDLRNIHYYFGRHRPNSLITHLWIQGALGVFLGLGVICVQFWSRMRQTFSDSLDVRLPRALPIVAAAAVAAALYLLAVSRRRAYETFLELSPGIDVDDSSIEYGPGHPVKKPQLRPQQIVKWLLAGIMLVALVVDAAYLL